MFLNIDDNYMNIKELIELISSKYPIYSLCEVDKLINNKAVKVSNQQDSKKIYINKINENDWYIVATNVYKCMDGYIGITGPCRLCNDRIEWKDINFPCEISEYDKVYSISYAHKSKDKINKPIESTVIEKLPEELIKETLISNNINNLTEEKIQHIKNIIKEVIELNKLNPEGSTYSLIVLLLMFMGGNTFKMDRKKK